jgi:hypothetical protein
VQEKINVQKFLWLAKAIDQKKQDMKAAGLHTGRPV